MARISVSANKYDERENHMLQGNLEEEYDDLEDYDLDAWLADNYEEEN